MMDLIQNVWPAALLAVGLASLFALILLIASIKLRVEVDPKVEEVHKALPGIDCGACGFAGCAAYAKAVAADPELIGRCAPGGAEVCDAIGRILNLQISGGGAPMRPIVHCRAHREDKLFYAEYRGIESCTSANAQPDVQACHFGCLGFGDCVRACKFDALHIVDGLSTVNYHNCTGCGACAKACPRNLIRMVPFTQDNMMVVACSSRENGKTTRTFCTVGCIGCGICAKQSELFTVADNLATLNTAEYAPSEATQKAMDKCPTGVIVYRGKTAPAPRQPKQKAAAVAT
ncbi:MAG TPA: RnfABCDGE type electron transport complex subunit B [Phycisphaerales bacterium]|nr:RnfABCDGE type electron transport complex subunit B [Phycisphaerales bacterium]